jgi:hypothetical protein
VVPNGVMDEREIRRSVSSTFSRGKEPGPLFLLTAVVLAACWIPVRRAAQVNPIETLRGV